MKPRWVVSNHGFVLPLTVGIGAILILLGTMMIIRASHNDVTAIATKSTSRSQAIAEAGLTHFQSLINRNRLLATACSTNTVSSDCASIPLTWNNFCPGTTTPNPGAYANLFNNWNNFSSVDADDQFRLVTYNFVPDTSTPSSNLLGDGELIVDGRVNQEGNDVSRISTTRLEVKFQAEKTIKTINDLPALWFQAVKDSSAETVTFATPPGFYIWDSSCPNQTDAARVQQFKNILNPNFSDYREIPGLPFPDLPPEGVNTPSGTGVYSDLNTIVNPATTLILPRSTDVLNGNQITYVVSQIDLTNGKELRFSRTNRPALNTVILYLNNGGSINISNGSRIRVNTGITLKIYSQGSKITLNSTGTNPAILSSTLTQLYGYTPAPIDISGAASNPLRLFIFAPQSSVSFTGANMLGGIWARSWQGSSSARLARSLPNSIFTSTIQVPRIKPFASWRRCRIPNSPPLDSCPIQ